MIWAWLQTLYTLPLYTLNDKDYSRPPNIFEGMNIRYLFYYNIYSSILLVLYSVGLICLLLSGPCGAHTQRV